MADKVMKHLCKFSAAIGAKPEDVLLAIAAQAKHFMYCTIGDPARKVGSFSDARLVGYKNMRGIEVAVHDEVGEFIDRATVYIQSHDGR